MLPISVHAAPGLFVKPDAGVATVCRVRRTGQKTPVCGLTIERWCGEINSIFLVRRCAELGIENPACALSGQCAAYSGISARSC